MPGIGHIDQLALTGQGTLPEVWHLSYVHQLGAGKRTFSGNLHPALGLFPEMSEREWCSRIAESDQPAYQAILAAAADGGADSFRLRYHLRLADGSFLALDDYGSVVQAAGGWPMLIGSLVAGTGRDRDYGQLPVIERLLAGCLDQLVSLCGGIDTMVEWCLDEAESGRAVQQPLEKTRNYSRQARGMTRLLQDLRSELDPGKAEDSCRIDSTLKRVEEVLQWFSPPSLSISCLIEPDLLPALARAPSRILELLLGLALDLREHLPQEQNATIKIHARRDAKDFSLVIEMTADTDSDRQPVPPFPTAAYDETLKDLDAYWHGDINARRVAVCIPGILGSAEKPSANRRTRARRTGSLPRLSTSKTVLLVEDEPLVRSSMMTWLDVLGLTALQAPDGETALKIYAEQADRIDFVLQDYILPGIDGQALLKKFKEHNPDLPVIVYSGYASGHDPEWIQQQGACAFLPKPFRIDDLAQLLCDLFENQTGP